MGFDTPRVPADDPRERRPDRPREVRPDRPEPGINEFSKRPDQPGEVRRDRPEPGIHESTDRQSRADRPRFVEHEDREPGINEGTDRQRSVDLGGRQGLEGDEHPELGTDQEAGMSSPTSANVAGPTPETLSKAQDLVEAHFAGKDAVGGRGKGMPGNAERDSHRGIRASSSQEKIHAMFEDEVQARNAKNSLRRPGPDLSI